MNFAEARGGALGFGPLVGEVLQAGMETRVVLGFENDELIDVASNLGFEFLVVHVGEAFGFGGLAQADDLWLQLFFGVLATSHLSPIRGVNGGTLGVSETLPFLLEVPEKSSGVHRTQAAARTVWVCPGEGGTFLP